MKFPKHQYIRSPKLMEAAREIPCQHCGADDFSVCAAHTNWQGGKGRGIKADDNLIASLCFRCHYELDQGSKLSKQERQKMWLEAHNKTVALLQERGLWPADVPIPNFQDL